MVCPISFVWFIWSVVFIWLNKTNWMNGMHQRNHPNEMDQIEKTYLILPFYTTDWWFEAAGRKAEVKVKQGGGWGR